MEDLVDIDIDRFFYGKNQNIVWNQIEQSIGAQNTKKLGDVIITLKPTFAKHWYKGSENLLLWRKYFQSNQLLLQQTIVDIKKLTGVTDFVVFKIPIYLIADPAHNDREINSWFSWTPKESFMVVEIPISFKPPKNLLPVSILAHEFFHLILRRNENLSARIKKTAKESEKLLIKMSDGTPINIFLEELLVSSFIPEGYLGQTYFNTRMTTDDVKKTDNLLEWRRYTAHELKITAKNYIKKNKKIDEEFLKSLIKTIKTKINTPLES